MKLNIEGLADAEIAWWDCYHRRDWSGVERAVKDLRREQFGIEISVESAQHFVRAADAYISYKKSLSDNDEFSAQEFLKIARTHMEEHYKDIEDKLKEFGK